MKSLKTSINVEKMLAILKAILISHLLTLILLLFYRLSSLRFKIKTLSEPTEIVGSSVFVVEKLLTVVC